MTELEENVIEQEKIETENKYIDGLEEKDLDVLLEGGKLEEKPEIKDDKPESKEEKSETDDSLKDKPEDKDDQEKPAETDSKEKKTEDE